MQNTINGIRKWLSVNIAIVLLKNVIGASGSKEWTRANITGSGRGCQDARRCREQAAAERRKQVGARGCEPIRWAMKSQQSGRPSKFART